MSSQLQNGEQQFVDNNGKPLNGGTVDFYIPNTTTRKDTWQDQNQTILNTNPIILDAGGRAIIWGEGIYRQILKDKHGNLIWDKVVADAGESLSKITGASRVGADDGVSGALFTTVGGFISKIMSSAGSAIVGFLQAGVGAVTRTVQDKLRDTVSVFDFMTPAQILDVTSGAAIIDVTSAIQAAINHCMKQYDPTQTTNDSNNVTYQGKQKTLFFPSGIYKISDTLNFSFRNQIEIYGEDQFNTIIRWSGADNGMMFDVRCSSYVTMSKFTLDGAFKALTFIYHAGNGVNAVGSKGNVTGNHYNQIYFWNQIGYLSGPITEFPDQYNPLSAQLCTATAFGAPTFSNSMDDSVIDSCRFAPNSINNNYAISISSSEVNINDCQFFGANVALIGNGTDIAFSRCVASLAAPHLNDGTQNHAFIKFWYNNCGQVNNVALMNCYMESLDYLGSGYSAKLVYMGQGPSVPADNMPHIRQILVEGGLYSVATNNWLNIDFQSNNRATIKLVNAGFQGVNKGYIYAPNSAIEIIDNGISTLTTGTPIWQPIVNGFNTMNRHYSTPDFQIQGEKLMDITVTIGATDEPGKLHFLSLDEALTFISSTKSQVTIFLEKNDTISGNFTLNSNIFIAIEGFTLTINGSIKNFGQLTIDNSFVNNIRAGLVTSSSRNLINYGNMTIKDVAISNLVTANGGKVLFDNVDFQGASDVVSLGDTAEVDINQDNCTYSATGFVVNMGSKFSNAIVKSSFGATPTTGKWMRGTIVQFTNPSIGFANLYWATSDGVGAAANWAKIGTLS